MFLYGFVPNHSASNMAVLVEKEIVTSWVDFRLLYPMSSDQFQFSKK